jgi:hypothetical protein
MVEVTEEDAALATLMRKMANDPKYRAYVAKAAKEIEPERYPESSFADVKVDDLDKKLESKFAEFDAKQETARVERRLREQKKALSEKYEPEQIAEIEKLMEKHGLHDYDIGAKVYAADVPPIDPKRGGLPPPAKFGERWEFPPNMEEFRKDPAGAALRGAYADIDRLRRGETLGG